MNMTSVDYGVYLVTDSTPAILGDKDICQVVEAALRGGVTIVQYRDKHCSHEVAVKTAKKLHEITKKYDVPLLINDRVEVAVEIGCEGVHIGQDDMEFEQAKKLLGPGKIIGVSANTKDEALKACEAGADYLGIGAVFSTATKTDTKHILGPSGVRDVLSALTAADYNHIPTVCIGGVNASNTSSVLSQSAAPKKSLDGVAVVSAIMAATDPAAAARDLLAKVTIAKIPNIIKTVADKTPLSHNMTNLVVQNFAANIALAVGASPIMAGYGEEAKDLAALGGALLINMGSTTPDGIKNYKQALKAYNEANRPVLFDPVGAGATAIRRAAVKDLMSSGQFALIKGNEGEIQTVYGTTIRQHGVDSTSSLTLPQRAALAASLARRHSNIVVLTGATDIVSNGAATFRVDNGHAYLGMITGTGCTLGTTLSAMMAVVGEGRGERVKAAVAGTVMFGVAAEMAAGRTEVRGPGTFVPAFIDELYGIRKATAEGDMRWMTMAKVKAVEVDDSVL